MILAGRAGRAALPQLVPGEKFLEFLQGVGAVAQPVFHVRFQFGERLLESHRHKQRVVAKTVFSPRLEPDPAFTGALKELGRANGGLQINRHQRDDALKRRPALFERNVLEQLQQLVVVVGIGRVAGRADSCAAKRAECTPGAPFSASTSSPESSASTKSGDERRVGGKLTASQRASSAFFVALPAKVSASSTTLGGLWGKSLSVRIWDTPPRMAWISPTLWALRVAITMVVTGKRYQSDVYAQLFNCTG